MAGEVLFILSRNIVNKSNLIDSVKCHLLKGIKLIKSDEHIVLCSKYLIWFQQIAQLS